jgi:hypothetical protein
MQLNKQTRSSESQDCNRHKLGILWSNGFDILTEISAWRIILIFTVTTANQSGMKHMYENTKLNTGAEF